MAWVIEEPEAAGWAIDPAPAAPPKKREYRAAEVPLEALKNFPASAMEMVGGSVNALLSPGDTLSGLANAGVGAVNLATPDWMPKITRQGLMEAAGLAPFGTSKGSTETGEDQARAIGQMVKDQYGGWENIKRTMAEDPAVAASDLLTILTAGGAAASKVPALGKLGNKLTAPGRAIVSAPGKVVSKGMDSLGGYLYGTALSFPEDVGFAGKAAAVKAGKESGIVASEAGVGKLKEKIGALSQELDGVLAKAEAAGVSQDFVDLWGKLDDLKVNHDLGVTPVKLERAIDQMINEYGALASRTGRVSYTPSELNTLKKALAAEVKYSSAPGAGTSSAKMTVNAAAAKNAREALNAVDPEIPRINAELSPLLNLRDPLYSAAFKNKATTPHPFIAGGVGHAVAGAPGGLAAMLFGPKLLTKAGIALGKGAKKPPLAALLGPAPLGGYYADRAVNSKNTGGQ